ncbi:hypothetical protein B0H13DRAFT_1862400 [Mycena leptocephala]|nr:hypothetical protein B0H13DRAFT_1862400 [Mycena leptocephala]
MHFALSLIPLLLPLSSSVLFAAAQGNDEFGSITAFFSVSLVNISMELMSGKDTVNDIIGTSSTGMCFCLSPPLHLALNVSPTVGTLYYQPHTMMPDGNYFVRVNGTVTKGDSTTPLSTASGSSTAFDISPSGPSDSTCLENTWTPIRSVEDPNYKPVRVILPTLGSLAGSTQQSVFVQADISGTAGILELQVPKVDQLFDIRVNLTSSNAEISVLSDTFLVVAEQGDEPSCKVKASASTARRSRAMSNGLWGICFLAGLSLFATITLLVLLLMRFTSYFPQPVYVPHWNPGEMYRIFREVFFASKVPAVRVKWCKFKNIPLPYLSQELLLSVELLELPSTAVRYVFSLTFTFVGSFSRTELRIFEA